MRSWPCTKRQPYAELILRGEKFVENRTWRTHYRGEILIHAGKSRRFLTDHPLGADPDLVFGSIVGRVTIVDCVRVVNLPRDLQSHAHATGPWCWILTRAIRLDSPVPCRGQTMLFDAPEDISGRSVRWNQPITQREA